MLVTLLALSVVVMGYLVSAAPVRLASSAPAVGELLAAPPEAVSLTFTGRIDPGDTHVSVATAGGARVTVGASRVDDRTVTQPVAIGDGGAYLVAYHAAFGGGQEVSGILRFRVAGAGAAAASPGPNSTTRTEPGEPREAADGGHPHGRVDPLTIAVISVDVLVVLTALVLMRMRRRRRDPTVSGLGENRLPGPRKG